MLMMMMFLTEIKKEEDIEDNIQKKKGEDITSSPQTNIITITSYLDYLALTLLPYS